MKGFIALIFLALVVLFTWQYYEDQKVKDKQLKIEEEAKRQESLMGSKGTRHGRQRLICFLCKGERTVMIRNRGAFPDFRQNCPICGTLGYRDITVPQSRVLCGDCKGMGNVLQTDKTSSLKKVTLTGGLAQKMSCARCSGDGTVHGGPPPLR